MMLWLRAFEAEAPFACLRRCLPSSLEAMATIAVSVLAAFESRASARLEVRRHLGGLFSNVMKVVPLRGGYVVHALGQHSRSRRLNSCKFSEWIRIVEMGNVICCTRGMWVHCRTCIRLC